MSLKKIQTFSKIIQYLLYWKVQELNKNQTDLF